MLNCLKHNMSHGRGGPGVRGAFLLEAKAAEGLVQLDVGGTGWRLLSEPVGQQGMFEVGE